MCVESGDNLLLLHTTIVSCLQAIVNPIMRNSRGQLLTPVDAAVARGHKGCAQYLQLHGATSAAKLTDKRALQLALSKCVRSSHHMQTT